MEVSIIICTRNRASSLKATLESLGKMGVPPGFAVELLVVDNGSTDNTAEVVSGAGLKNFIVRHLLEPKPGLSRARNAGVTAASGEILLFTDDDIRVPTNWLAVMSDPILKGVADAVGGGVIFPPEHAAALSKGPLLSRHGWFASTKELDPQHPARMVGANMAFHRRVLSKVPQFDVELGAGALGSGEETLFSFQLAAAGFKIVGALDDTVEHHFDLERLTGEGLLDLARKMGRSHAFLFHHWEHKSSRLAVPRLFICRWQRFWAWCFKPDAVSEVAVSEKILRLEENLAFYREYLVQRRREFKYRANREFMAKKCAVCEAV